MMSFKRPLGRAAHRALAYMEKHPASTGLMSSRFNERVRREFPVVCVDGANATRYFVQTADTYIGREIIERGAFEARKVRDVLAAVARAGFEPRTVLDIGANIGTNVVEALRLLPEAGAIAFEPEPENFKLLRINVIANDLDDRVEARRVALSDVTGSAIFEVSKSNPGDHRVRPAAPAGDDAFAESTRNTIEVPAVRLDDLDEGFADRGTLVFMDVQGHEGHVMAGARQTFAAGAPLATEMWPYGLDRAGGRQLFFDGLAAYSQLFEMRATGPVALRHDELAALADSLTTEAWGFTEILALP